MVCNIVTSPIMLRMPSVPATPEDIAIGRDLADTLAAHSHECVGLAANMIGKRKCVIAVTDGPRTLVMFNPRIIERHDEYQTEEACLSLEGMRPCTRYRSITSHIEPQLPIRPFGASSVSTYKHGRASTDVHFDQLSCL